MTDPDTEKKSANGEETEKSAAVNDSVSVPLDDLDESKAQLIKSNGGAGDHAEVEIIDGSESDVSFNGLGKDEVMQYANDPFWVRLRWVLFILFWVGWFAMLVTAIVIIVVAPRCPPRPDLKWYQKDTVYQAYSKSFKDSDKDGFGDFKGLEKKLDYITDDVGANAVYLSSIFKTDSDPTISSEDADFAIVDHKDLHPKFAATVDSFGNWIKKLRKKGQSVIVDLIPNQTGKKHEWFEKSRKAEKDYKDYYIWAGSGSNGSSNSPPNDWKNMFGESAWEFDSERNQYYYHSRSKDLPDLNLNNEAVRKEILDVVKFWFGKGVGGFNIKDLEYLVEEKDTSKADGRDFNGTITFLKELRKIANDYSDKPGRERFLFGRVEGINNDTRKYWENDGKVLHMIAPQMPIGLNCDASCITEFIESIPDGGNNWLALQLSNPDEERFSSQAYGSASNFVKIAHAVQMLLPGTPINYYGDEFGQKDGVKPSVNGRFDPSNARTPMQWTDDEKTAAGFTDKDIKPWNEVGPDYKNNNLRVSRANYNDHTSFRLLQKLVELRERESFQWGKTKACAPNKNLLLFNRKAERFPYFLTLINLSDKDDAHPYLPSLKSCVDSKKMGKVVFHSSEDDGDKRDFSKAVMLSPGDIMVIEFAADD